MDTDTSLFVKRASAESFRVALCLASNVHRSAGSTDITGAFLLAARPSDKPSYGGLPPRVLAQAGLASPDDVFLVRRPLYGLREAPALWSQFRSEKLAALKVPFEDGWLVLQPLITDSELWRIMFVNQEGEQHMCGILVMYVSDLLYLCLRCVMLVLHQASADMWPRLALEMASQEDIRYLHGAF